MIGTHVPPILTIKARQIQDWAKSQLEARSLLAVLLRKLVHSTGLGLRQVDFPGYDNAERKGWDGIVEASIPTPWIPEGLSGWEFGVRQRPGEKAEEDYKARVNSVPKSERENCTYVFVTPANWPGKTKWARSKNATGDWKEVRALDASDLEQWLEQSISGQIWLAEKLAIPVAGIETLDHFWRRWANASEPPMAPEIFEPSATAHLAKLQSWLMEDCGQPLTIAADSKDEALAFLAYLFERGEMSEHHKDIAVIFRSPEALKTLVASSGQMIPIVNTDEVERELAVVCRQFKCIAGRSRNTVGRKPDLAVDLLGYEEFETALAAMGIEGYVAAQLARETGRSPTILRRRRSNIEAIRTPLWAGDPKIARRLIPISLIGAWQATSKADREILSTLAEQPYSVIEETVARLLQLDDCPVWSIDHHRGVASKIDALFAISKMITAKDLTDFFTLAEYVLSETDPALDLPEERRWAAGLYGKVRNHSETLRESISEALVILSVHGDGLFRQRLGVNVEAHVAMLVRRLLTPLTPKKLQSSNDDLPRYAEAAPDEFLRLIEADLERPEPAVLKLLKPADSGPLGRCLRAGLLSALECLAWDPKKLSRVIGILAQLSRIQIDDNWLAKPIHSLAAVFRPWAPQTAAPLEERVKALENLVRRYPDTGWQICMEQFDPMPRFARYSYRPRRRSDASGVAKRVSDWDEVNPFLRRALDLALAWHAHDARTLGDLVECLSGLPDDEDQSAVWDLIDAWSRKATDERAKADLRERIRRWAFTRPSKRAGLGEIPRDRARDAYEELEPRDPVFKHAWLFADQWIDESRDEIEEEKPDFHARAQKIHELRMDAIKEVCGERGFDGVIDLLELSNAPHVIGQYAVPDGSPPEEPASFVRQCLSFSPGLERSIDGCLMGYLSRLDDHTIEATLSDVANEGSIDQTVRLLRCAPFHQHTWRLAHRQGEEVEARYWREVNPYRNRQSLSELGEAIDRLIEADRPRTALHITRYDLNEIQTSRLKRLLIAVGTVSSEPDSCIRIDPYHISEALISLDRRSDVNPNEMAQLELLFIGILHRSKHGIRNLERKICELPATFVQAVAMTCRNRDTTRDPPEWGRAEPGGNRERLPEIHDLLFQISRVPGSDDDGAINTHLLSAWVSEARELCSRYDCAEMGDQWIGKLLSNAPAEENGLWPCLPVCEAMEIAGSQRIAAAFSLWTRNSRGMVRRELYEGGDQERELAAKYRSWADHHRHEFPLVGGILDEIASSYDVEAARIDAKANVDKRLDS